MAKPIPDGFHAVTPMLTLNDAAKTIDFYQRALGAQELLRMPGPDGRIMHAMIKVGDSFVMMGEECSDMPGCRSPQSSGVRSAGLYLYVPDADAAFKRAADAGAKVVQPPADMFWGDRAATIEDPSGHQWTLATHREDLAPEEIGRRQEQFFASMGQKK